MKDIVCEQMRTKEEQLIRELKALSALEKVFALRNETSMQLEANRVAIVEFAVNNYVDINEVCSKLENTELERVKNTIRLIKTLQEELKNGLI